MIPEQYGDVPPDDLSHRRAAVLERLGGGAMVLAAAPIQYASRDTERLYVADRELFYLTGLTEPETVAVLVGGAEPRLVLFARPRDPDAELWSGVRLGVDSAVERAGADEGYPVSSLAAELPGLLAGVDRIHYRLGRDDLVSSMVVGALATARARGARHGTGPRGLIDPGEILDEIRLVKDERELSALRTACRVTAHGHRAGASRIRPGVGEWVIEAAVNGAFRESGATRPGFDTIVGGGQNGCVLHYVSNDQPIPEGGLVLVDAGAEVAHYHGDITRTWPASGRFTDIQRDVYDLVEAARRAGVEASTPGNTIMGVHSAATAVLVAGLVDLRVLKGSPETLIETGAHKPFFPHQTSHWLGLDVHDPADYERAGKSRELAPGMVFTVEPGLYFRPELCSGRASRFAGIGVRIEDDVAITSSGCEVLTADLPTAPDEVEGMVG
jgi:Xaa-Pro aminopeptidase